MKLLTYSLALILLFILVGGYLRSVNILETMYWWDGGRDAFVARHMAEFNEFPLIAPVAGAGGGLLLNSPVYYYLLALVWKVSVLVHYLGDTLPPCCFR